MKTTSKEITNKVQFNLTHVLSLLFILISGNGYAQENNWYELTKLPIATADFSLNEYNGKLYVIGGMSFESSLHMLSNVQIYEMGTGVWSTGTNAPSAGALTSQTLIGDKIYTLGWWPESVVGPATSRVNVYDIEKDSWGTSANMQTARLLPGSCVLDGKLYVMGGERGWHSDSLLRGFTSMERYDPVTDTWDSIAPMKNGRWILSACTLNGKIYAIGGLSEGRAVSTVEEYDPVSDQWTTKKSMHYPRSEMGIAVLNNKIYAIGGGNNTSGSITYNHFEVYDPITDNWILSKDHMPIGKFAFMASDSG